MKIVTAIIGITVSIIVLAVLLVPMTNEDNYKVTATNTVGYPGTIADSSEDIDLHIEIENNVVKINDITYTYSINDVVMFTEDAMLLSTTVSPFISFNYMLNGTRVVNAGINALDLTASEGTINATITSSTNTVTEVTLDYNWICFRDNAGEDRIFNVITNSKTVYYDNDNPIYAVTPNSSGIIGYVNEEVSYQDNQYEGTLNGRDYRGDVKEATLSFQQANTDLSFTYENSVFCPFYGASSGTVDASTQVEKDAYGLLPIIPVMFILAILIGAVLLITRRD